MEYFIIHKISDSFSQHLQQQLGDETGGRGSMSWAQLLFLALCVWGGGGGVRGTKALLLVRLGYLMEKKNEHN